MLNKVYKQSSEACDLAVRQYTVCIAYRVMFNKYIYVGGWVCLERPRSNAVNISY